MKKDIILSGVGGQGILSISAIIGTAALKKNMCLKQSEVHGMSQRGGDVSANMRIPDSPVHSDLIPQGQADIIISVEPMEALRYKHMLSETGWIITNSKPKKNIPNYPEIDELLAEFKDFPNSVVIEADKIASELGSKRSANVVVLGAASKHLGFSYEEIEDAIKTIFGRKGDKVVNVNLKALKAGSDFADNNS